MQASAYLGDLGGLPTAAGRSLVLLDLRGTGQSETPADPSSYRVDRQVDDVETLRTHLGPERIDVLAHSASGDLALLHAASGEDGYNEEAAHAYPGPGAFDDAAAVREVLTKLDAPVLVLAGELAPSPRPDKAAEVAALFPRGEFVVQPGAAHIPWLDDPEFFVRTVGEFLSRSDA